MAKLLIPLEVVETLKEFKETKYWAAMQVFFDAYVQWRKDTQWGSLETDPNFAIKHAKDTGGALALKFVREYINKELKRESDEQHI